LSLKRSADRAGWIPGFFDVDERLRELSGKGDALERVKSLIDFEMFRCSAVGGPGRPCKSA